jgi:hypothetical protein
MNTKHSFMQMLKNQSYSDKTIKKLWKWYDSTEKKGVASF